MAAVEDDTSWDSETREHTVGNGNPLSHIGVQNILNCGLVCSVKKRLAPHNLQPQLHTCAHACTHARKHWHMHVHSAWQDWQDSIVSLSLSLARSFAPPAPSLHVINDKVQRRCPYKDLLHCWIWWGGNTQIHVCVQTHTFTHTHTHACTRTFPLTLSHVRMHAHV